MGKEAKRVTGTIAMLSGEGHVWPSFAGCMARLAQRHPRAHILHVIGTNIAASRNTAVRQMQGDWLWFIDTDMVFVPETLERLLAHNVDIVQVLCLIRHPPHYPVIYGAGDAPGTFKQAVFNPEGTPRLVEVAGVGTGGTLIRKRVFDALDDPWYEVGRLKAEELGEDLHFSRKAAAKGFKMWTDMTTPVGHLTPAAVWPIFKDPAEGWKTGYKLTAGDAILVPPAKE